MPRTKRPAAAKKVTALEDSGETFANFVTQQKHKIDIMTKKKCHEIELAFQILAESLGQDMLQRTIGDLKNEIVLKEDTNTRYTTNSTATTQSASQDDGYQTESSSHRSGSRSTTGKRMANPCPPTTVGRGTARRSRSTDARKVTQTATKTMHRVISKSGYKTPVYNKIAASNFPPITPKMAPNTPMAVMRQLRQGETVVSMSGSPVLVPTYNVMQQSEKANCNILLDDGTVLFLKPNQLRQSSSYIPFSLMGASVLEQLETLKNNLDTMLRIGEKNIKEKAKEM